MQGFGSVLQIYYYQHMGRVMIIKFFNHSFHARQNTNIPTSIANNIFFILAEHSSNWMLL